MSWPAGILRRVPAPVLVIIGIVSLQVGAAIAKGLFTELPPTAFVWLRLLTSALILVAIARPRLRGRMRGDLLVAIGFGFSLMLMNWSIYQAMARIPLGMAVTLEFLGPLAVAIVGSLRRRDLIWIGLAGLGVALLGFDPRGLNLAGVGFALLAAASWAAYILLSRETGRRWQGISGLAVASVVGAVGLAIPAVLVAGDQLLQPRLLIIGVLVGLMSSVIPYSLELSALRRIPANVFGIMMSLEPAAATFAAWILLGEFLTLLQWLAVACVITASVGITWSARGRP
jgi:inner membrane transporter RhtA